MANVVTVDLDAFKVRAFDKAVQDLREKSLDDEFILCEMLDKQNFIDELLLFCVPDDDREITKNGNGK